MHFLLHSAMLGPCFQHGVVPRLLHMQSSLAGLKQEFNGWFPWHSSDSRQAVLFKKDEIQVLELQEFASVGHIRAMVPCPQVGNLVDLLTLRWPWC